jgi:hypothetical protein
MMWCIKERMLTPWSALEQLTKKVRDRIVSWFSKKTLTYIGRKNGRLDLQNRGCCDTANRHLGHAAVPKTLLLKLRYRIFIFLLIYNRPASSGVHVQESYAALRSPLCGLSLPLDFMKGLFSTRLGR